MKDIDLQKIWKSAYAEKKTAGIYSPQDIEKYRNKRIKETRRSVSVSIKIDMTLKGLIAVSYGILLFSPDTAVYQFTKFLLGFACIFLAGIEMRILKHFKTIDYASALLEHLRKQIDFLNGPFKKYNYLAGLTNPLFMTSGFFYYEIAKYGSIQMGSPLESPVLYLLLLVGYALSFFAVLPFQRIHVRELQECLLDMDDDALAVQKIREQRKRYWKSVIIASVFLLLGLLALLIMIY